MIIQTFEFLMGKLMSFASRPIPLRSGSRQYPSGRFVLSVRIPLRHVGMGQMMALDQKEIEALAAKSNLPRIRLSGRCNYISERGVTSSGTFGQQGTACRFDGGLGFSSDMGVTNSRYPEEICEGQMQMDQGSMMGLSYDQLDVSTEDMEDVDLYMHSLGVRPAGM